MWSSSSVSIPIIIIIIVISTISNEISASDLTQSIKSSKDHANKLQSTSESTNNDNNEQRCEKITIPMCMDIGYNYTSMPNLLEMDTQEEAGLEVHQFWPLVEINCSDDLKFFLCSMYVPICIEEYSGHIPSCKSVCERAREGCKPIMIQYGFPWPDKMNCSELPVYGDSQHICMDPKKGTGVEMDTNGSNNNNNDNNNFNDVQFVDKFNNHNNKANNNNHNHHHMSNNNNNKAKVKNNSNNNNNNFNGNKNHQLSSYSTTYSTNYYYPSATDNNNNNNNVMIFDPYDDVNNNNGNNNNNKLPTLINNNEMVMRTQSPINNDMNMISNHNNYNECRCDCRVPYFIRLKSPSSTQTFDDQQKQQQSPQHSSHYHHYNSYQSIHHFNHSKIETASGLAPMCALSCKGAFHFNEDEQETSFFWIGITAAICAITCILTVFTSLTDTERFRYPERAIIFLAACYIFIAGGYLLRIRLGHNAIACDGPFIRYQRTGPTPASCILSFILLYFFGMASAYWWLILTLTWFLAAGLKWSSEAITSYAQYFHLLAWLLPTAQSLTILCLGAIDGDPFMGVCSVGNQSRANLLIFVITPLCVCITIGIMFLITGFVALFRIRRAIRQTQHTIRVKTDKLEKLMIRIGLSSFLYIVPEVVVVACHIYEYIYRPLWEKSLTCLCKDNNEQYTPQFSIIVMKYVMSLIIGITSSFWIWSGKTLESWMRIYTKISCCASPFGSPNSSRSSGTSQLLPNLGNYYGRGMTVLNGGSSAPIKTQSVVNQLGSTISQPNTPHHHSIHVHHQHHDLQSRQTQSIILPPTRPPSIPPPLPPPPPSMMAAMTTGNHSHHHHHNQQQNLLHHHHHHGGSGSLNGSQFSHLIGSINAINSTTNNNNKHPLSHV